MLKNLIRVLEDKNITRKTFAEYLGISERTLQNKVKETTAFTYPEVKKTCTLFSEYNSDFLFKSFNEKAG